MEISLFAIKTAYFYFFIYLERYLKRDIHIGYEYIGMHCIYYLFMFISGV